MGSEVAFWPMRSASFALHVEHLPVGNHSPLEREWSILLRLHAKACTHKQISVLTSSCLAVEFTDFQTVCFMFNAARQKVFRMSLANITQFCVFQVWLEVFTSSNTLTSRRELLTLA